MMKTKLLARIFSLVICMGLSVSALTACGNGDSSASSSSDAGSSAPDSSVTDSSSTDSGEDSKADEPVIMEFTDKTAAQIVEEMGNGWNLGNTMEACGINASDPIAFETCWGQPITENGILEGVKAAGFDSVRVPVAWSNMMSDDGTYTIDDAYFDRVEEIINYVIGNDMYCIINIHWDGGWWEAFGSEDEAVRNAAMDRYEAMWTQIADRYKGYSEKLIFESANEELGERYFSLAMRPPQTYKLTNEINQRFVDIVRASGGNNDKRCLLIAGYSTDIDKTCKDSYKMPTDTIEDHLMISVHYYTPSTYCIASEEDNSWGYRDSWGTDEDIAEMRSYFEKMKKFTDAGYPVIIGEYGVAQIRDENGAWVHKEGCDQFIKNVLLLSEEMGYCPMLWDCSNFFDRIYFKMMDENIAQIFLDAKAGTLK